MMHNTYICIYIYYNIITQNVDTLSHDSPPVVTTFDGRFFPNGSYHRLRRVEVLDSKAPVCGHHWSHVSMGCNRCNPSYSPSTWTILQV